MNLFSGTKKKLQPFWQMVFSLTVIISLLISHVLLSYGFAALQSSLVILPLNPGCPGTYFDQ